MKAVAFHTSLDISDPASLVDLELPTPEVGPHDLLVRVRAVSVNPVDTKVRKSAKPEPGQPRVLGFDAAGVVEAIGSEVTLFQPGEEVWYAGSILRPGTNAELHAVDERIVGHKPESLDFAAAAALPLTSLTAWELLFDRLGVPLDQTDRGQSILVVGAAGGVGSVLVQLARRLTSLRVIGTASRPETKAWVRELGAHEVIDHTQPLAAELTRLGQPSVTHVAALTQTDRHFEQLAEALEPQGRLAIIDDSGPVDVRLLKRKSLSLHWELMFTRPIFQTKDLVRQHEILDEVARLVDAGTIRTTVAEHFGRITAENLRRAHALLESGKARGKIVLEGF